MPVLFGSMLLALCQALYFNYYLIFLWFWNNIIGFYNKINVFLIIMYLILKK